MSLEIAAGDRLALVGENGAGKSTLMHLACGLLQPDSGTILFNGEKVKWKGPQQAMSRGIGMVHQHFMWVPGLSVIENVLLGREPRRGLLIDQKHAENQVTATCQQFGFELDLHAKVETLSIAAQQKVEIIKALHGGARLLILDEPTAVLTPQESDELFRITKELSSQGHAVVFITHKLKEVFSFATRVVVMRRGKKVLETRPEETSREALAESMVGKLETPPALERTPSPLSKPLLELRELSAKSPYSSRSSLSHVQLRINTHELVGIAGIDGNGQREMAEVLTGLLPWQSGAIDWKGQNFRHWSVKHARDLGIGHIPEDRHARAMVMGMSVEENLTLGRQRSEAFSQGPRIDFEGRRQTAHRLISEFDIRPSKAQLDIATLSGGNQQKCVLARELDMKPRLLVAFSPTRGLDIKATSLIHQRLRQACEEGSAVMLFSYDLDELLTLSDRLYVMFEGRVVAEWPRAQFDEGRIGRAMLGAAQ